MKAEKIPFCQLVPGQVFRFRAQWYARSLDRRCRIGYRMPADYGGYTKAVSFLPSTHVCASPAIERGPLPTPLSMRYLGRDRAA